tara:strand:+ start:357 stop:695 length:339 start_codon:yes stop_codon:yes gene_type:complete
MNKNTLSISVKEWFDIDEEIKILQTKIKELKQSKKNISIDVINNMKTNNIDILETQNGKLIHSEKKVRESITKKYLEICLKKFITNTDLVFNIIEYIYNSREIKFVDNIKRK